MSVCASSTVRSTLLVPSRAISTVSRHRLSSDSTNTGTRQPGPARFHVGRHDARRVTRTHVSRACLRFRWSVRQQFHIFEPLQEKDSGLSFALPSSRVNA